MRSLILFNLFVALLCPSCLFLDGSFHEKHLRAITFHPADNPGLRVTYECSVSPQGRSLTATIPDYVDASRLVPDVDFDGMSVEFDGRPWSPGQEVDFSTVSTLTIVGKDERALGYDLSVNIVPASTDKVLRGYELGGDSAYQYSGIYHEVISQDDLCEVTLYQQPYIGDLVSTWVGLSHTGISASFDGVAVTGRLANIDFNQPHTVTVTAEDLSTSTYTLRVQPESRLSGYVKVGGQLFSFDTEATAGATVIVPTGTNLTALNLYSSQTMSDENGVSYPRLFWHTFNFTGPRVFQVPSTYVSRTFTITVKTP